MKHITILLQAVVAWMMLSSAVSATTLNPGDSVNLDSGSFFDADRPVIAAATSFSDVYTFAANITMAVYKADGVFDGAVDTAYNIKNLTLTWFDTTTGTNVATDVQTNGTGVNIGPNTSTLALIVGHTYRLTVTGLTASDGGGYNFQVRGVSAVPIPPAALLLLTGLVGAGYAGRRKFPRLGRSAA